jgi:hypothetical protein
MCEDCKKPPPEKSVCWPNDPDYLDGKTEIELPPERFTKVFKGRLWRCITGDWLFDVGFTLIGREKSFFLSSLLPGNPNFGYPGWRGCDTLCIERIVEVPPGTIQLQDDTEVYETAAKVELRCCDGHIAVAGYEALEEYQFFQGA